mmetsp:Transcript_8071/g.29977  ORF Transcript_8071/g.29977 Transcript_8071/m.29977 type:complete len:85 (+) Transcript_8071:639-893(+)
MMTYAMCMSFIRSHNEQSTDSRQKTILTKNEAKNKRENVCLESARFIWTLRNTKKRNVSNRSMNPKRKISHERMGNTRELSTTS